MGFFWSFMWIVTYRDFAISVGTIGDEEAFIHPSSKVFISLENNFLDLLNFFFCS
jgi:hypothetical protein